MSSQGTGLSQDILNTNQAHVLQHAQGQGIDEEQTAAYAGTVFELDTEGADQSTAAPTASPSFQYQQYAHAESSTPAASSGIMTAPYLTTSSPSASQVHSTTMQSQPCTLPSAPDQQSTYRELYLLSFAQSKFARHWAIWYPKKGQVWRLGQHPEGTSIHVEGDSRNGFRHQIQRECYGPADDRRPWAELLGMIDDKYVVDGQGAGIDTTPQNTLEVVAFSIAAPGPSMTPASSEVRLAYFGS